MIKDCSYIAGLNNRNARIRLHMAEKLTLLTTYDGVLLVLQGEYWKTFQQTLILKHHVKEVKEMVKQAIKTIDEACGNATANVIELQSNRRLRVVYERHDDALQEAALGLLIEASEEIANKKVDKALELLLKARKIDAVDDTVRAKEAASTGKVWRWLRLANRTLGVFFSRKRKQAYAELKSHTAA